MQQAAQAAKPPTPPKGPIVGSGAGDGGGTDSLSSSGDPNAPLPGSPEAKKRKKKKKGGNGGLAAGLAVAGAAAVAGGFALKGMPATALSSLNMEIHFLRGENGDKVFQYWDKDPGPFKRNEARFTEEWKTFPDAFWPLAQKAGLPAKDPKTGQTVILGFAGLTMTKGDPQKNIRLAKRRSKSVACYVADYLRRHKIPNFILKYGRFNASKSHGPDPVSQAKDRFVKIFYGANKSLMEKEGYTENQEFYGGTAEKQNGSDGGLYKACFGTIARRTWQMGKWLKAWMDYRGKSLPPAKD